MAQVGGPQMSAEGAAMEWSKAAQKLTRLFTLFELIVASSFGFLQLHCVSVL
jgi:hypothetical protein